MGTARTIIMPRILRRELLPLLGFFFATLGRIRLPVQKTQNLRELNGQLTRFYLNVDATGNISRAIWYAYCMVEPPFHPGRRHLDSTLQHPCS